MNWTFVLALAFASSIDNLAAGLTYGIRGVRIGWTANLVIAAICGLFSLAGIFFGGLIAWALPGDWPDIAGAILLFLIGLRVLLLVIPRGAEAGSGAEAGESGWLARAFAAPSGRIGMIEAVILGVALSANALVNAVGAGMLQIPAGAVALTAALGSLITVWLGVLLGRHAARLRVGRFDLGRFGTAISGMTLVGLAVFQLH